MLLDLGLTSFAEFGALSPETRALWMAAYDLEAPTHADV